MAKIRIYTKNIGSKILSEVASSGNAEVVKPESKTDWVFASDYQYYFDAMLKYGIVPKIWKVRFSTKDQKIFTLFPFINYASLHINGKTGRSMYVCHVFSRIGNSNPAFHHEVAVSVNWKLDLASEELLDNIHGELRKSIQRSYIEEQIKVIAKIL